jgi:hypothetical protein
MECLADMPSILNLGAHGAGKTQKNRFNAQSQDEGRVVILS